MKKIFFTILPLMVAIMFCVNFSSCSKDEEEKQTPKEESELREPTALERQLFDTSWELYKIDEYTNGVKTGSYTKNKPTIFLSGERFYSEEEGQYIDQFVLHYTGDNNYTFERKGMWFASDNVLALSWVPALPYQSEIQEFSNKYLTLVLEYDSTWDVDKRYKKIYYLTRSSRTPNQESGGIDNTGEAPQIGFHDFSATKTSLTVKYTIFNKEEANISSAKIYYGTSSNPTKSVNASIAGVYITATITGLSKNTEYYVKCKATGSGGTTMTDVTKCITDY